MRDDQSRFRERPAKLLPDHVGKRLAGPTAPLQLGDLGGLQPYADQPAALGTAEPDMGPRESGRGLASVVSGIGDLAGAYHVGRIALQE